MNLCETYFSHIGEVIPGGAASITTCSDSGAALRGHGVAARETTEHGWRRNNRKLPHKLVETVLVPSCGLNVPSRQKLKISGLLNFKSACDQRQERPLCLCRGSSWGVITQL